MRVGRQSRAGALLPVTSVPDAPREQPGCTYCGETKLNTVMGAIRVCTWCSKEGKGRETMAMPKPKTGGNYLKAPKAGQSVSFRILGDPVEYFLGFKTTATEDGGSKVSVVRKKSLADFRPGEYDTMGKYGPTSPKYAMAFPVLAEDGCVKVFEVGQKTILDSLYALENNKKWGDLTKFDVTVTGDDDGKGYSVTPDPKTPINDAGREAWEGLLRNGFDLSVLISGADPFMTSAPASGFDPLNPNFDDTEGLPF